MRDSVPTRELPSGDKLPLVGFGTYSIPRDETEQVVRTAIEMGYRYLDCAEGYGNEAEVGAAVDEYNRQELFLASKLVPANHSYENVFSACEASLDRLGTDYLDLYMIHWPNPAVSLRETLDAMATLQEDGLVRNVGVCNFDAYHLKFARRIADVPIAVDQIELHPWFKQQELREYCSGEDVALTAAAPLARTRVFDDDIVRRLADEYGKSPAQITLRWQVQKGIATIPRSSSESHIHANFDVTDWELDDDDVDLIDGIDRRERVYTIDPDHDTYGISA